MGSKPDPIPFAQLALKVPSPDERRAIWAATHQQWGAALDLETYLRREAFLTTVPMSRNGGMTPWLLTTADGEPNDRPILSSCESIRKRCLVASPDGNVRECTAHGIASVFTEPPHRGAGYASEMMARLGPRLDTWQGRKIGSHCASAADEAANGMRDGDGSPGGGTGCEDREVACSVLFSDIGKTFYTKNGWPPFESTHLSFLPAPAPETAPADSPAVHPVSYHDLPELCSLDERLLKARLARPASTTRVALVPDLDAILWHLMREDFMTKHIFNRTPVIRGGIVGEPGRRVWAVWTRGYYGGLKKPEGNTMHILRVVVEDPEACDKAYLTSAIGAVLSLARSEAAEWKVNHVEMWNPTPEIRALVDAAGLPYEFVSREKDSIASLMWYGEGEVEWVDNEKYGWC